MRAVIAEKHGGPDVLRLAERDTPTPGPGQLLVDVTAAGVNFADIYRRQGLPPYGGNVPYIAGSEGAGTVTAAGSGAGGVGTRIAWTDVPGSYAEQVLVPADRAVLVPDGVDLEVAAAVMLQGLTAHYLSTDTYPVASGDAVVVHAAAGGVGLLLTQMVTRRGGVVIATTSTKEKAELARNAGAAYLAGYDNFGTVTKEATSDGAAVVYDGVGRATFDDSLAVLRRRGYMVLYGGASGPVPPLELQRLAVGGSLFVTRPTLVSYITTRDELVRRADDLFTWIRQGALDVHIGGRYPLDQAARAHEDLAARRTTGKLLLLPG
jgi:NADPH:quinone reductase